MTKILTISPCSSGSGFFVKKTRFPVTASFFREAGEIIDRVEKLCRRDVVEEYISLQTRSIRIEHYTHNKYIVRTEAYNAVRRGYISPSMFVKYRGCARELAIEIIEVKKLGGVLVSVDQLKSYLKGLLVHKLYYEKYAVGETEVYVESPKHKILGYIDEVRREDDRYVLVELKSSYNVDTVGAGLQVMGYMYAFSNQESVSEDFIEGYILAMSGVYKVGFNREVFDEYMKRVRLVVEIALRGEEDKLPPRLPLRLSHRCKICPYKSSCLSLPDKYRTYTRYFEAMGFRKLTRAETVGTLHRYLLGRNSGS